MEAKHTQTPWTVEAPNDHDPEGEGRIVHKYAIRGPGVPPIISFQICQLSSINGNEQADAAFIVRACNCIGPHLDMLDELIRKTGLSEPDLIGRLLVAEVNRMMSEGA